jgi:hypothetical protein
MNLQEMFEIAVVNLLCQGERSTECGDCLYRGPNGLKCAIGFLIPDEKYNETLECTPAGDILCMIPEVFGFRQDFDVTEFNRVSVFLDNMQSIHDNTCLFETGQWPISLIKLGQRFGLETDWIDKLCAVLPPR